MYQDKTNIK